MGKIRDKGKVKGFKRTGDAEAKITNEQKIRLIKRAIDHVDFDYNRFHIRNTEIVTKQTAKTWAFKFDN